MIIVCAASGRIGQRVLQLLAAQADHLNIAAGARNPVAEGAGSWDGEFRLVDYDDLAGMIKAFAGAERVVFIPSFADTEQRATQGRNVVRAAEQASIEQIVFVGIMDTRKDSPLPFARAYGEIEEALNQSPVSTVILRTSMYTDNLAEQYAMWLKTGQLVTCAGNGKISYVSRDDIAASIVGVLSTPIEAHNNRVYTLTGPEALSYEQIATLINELFDTNIQIINVEREEFAKRLKEIWGVAYDGIEHVARVTPLFQTVFKQGLMSAVSSDVEELSGKKPESVRDWLMRHRKSFA